MNLWYLLVLVLSIWLIYDVIVNQKRMEQLHKILWIVGALIPAINVAVIIIYYFVVIRK